MRASAARTGASAGGGGAGGRSQTRAACWPRWSRSRSWASWRCCMRACLLGCRSRASGFETRPSVLAAVVALALLGFLGLLYARVAAAAVAGFQG